MKFVAIVSTLLSSVMLGASMPTAASQGRVSNLQDPDAIIARARAAVGGAKRLDNVKSVELIAHWVDGDRSIPRTYRWLYPDRFQLEMTTVTHTLLGDDFWRRPEVDPARKSFVANNTRAQFMDMSLALLLRVPYDQPGTYKYLGTQSLDGRQAHAVEVTIPLVKPRVLLIDTSTNMPLAVTKDAVSSGDPSRPIAVVLKLGDFKTVNGIQVPFQIEERFPKSRPVIKMTNVRIDSGIGPAAFAKPQE